jgi:hypothetical protein
MFGRMMVEPVVQLVPGVDLQTAVDTNKGCRERRDRSLERAPELSPLIAPRPRGSGIRAGRFMSWTASRELGTRLISRTTSSAAIA